MNTCVVRSYSYIFLFLLVYPIFSISIYFISYSGDTEVIAGETLVRMTLFRINIFSAASSTTDGMLELGYYDNS
jgi:hypothetical protein